MRYFIFTLLCFCIALPALAQDKPRAVSRIVAIVNDELITITDLNDRMALAFFSSGLPDNDETRARLLPQVLRGLIDEQVQRQEAKRIGVTVAPEEIKQAALRLAQDNKVDPAQLDDMLKARGVPPRALYSQIEGGMLWSKVIQRRLRPLVEVGEEEVAARLERLQANAGKPEYLVAEIFLRVDESKDEAEVQTFANGLLEQMKAGTSFSAMAQQFSQGAGALQGGDLGWVQQGQLAAELDRALTGAQKGAITNPIRTPAGYHILLVRDTRLASGVNPAAMTVALTQVFVPAGQDMAERIKTLHDSTRGCSGLSEAVQVQDAAASVRDLGTKTLGELPAWLAARVQNLSVGQSSDIYELENGALFVVLCDRKTGQSDGGPSAEQVTQQIGTERLELQARRLLRDLRRQATVEIRQ